MHWPVGPVKDTEETRLGHWDNWATFDKVAHDESLRRQTVGCGLIELDYVLERWTVWPEFRVAAEARFREWLAARKDVDLSVATVVASTLKLER